MARHIHIHMHSDDFGHPLLAGPGAGRDEHMGFEKLERSLAARQSDSTETSEELARRHKAESAALLRRRDQGQITSSQAVAEAQRLKERHEKEREAHRLQQPWRDSGYGAGSGTWAKAGTREYAEQRIAASVATEPDLQRVGADRRHRDGFGTRIGAGLRRGASVVSKAPAIGSSVYGRDTGQPGRYRIMLQRRDKPGLEDVVVQAEDEEDAARKAVRMMEERRGGRWQWAEPSRIGNDGAILRAHGIEDVSDCFRDGARHIAVGIGLPGHARDRRRTADQPQWYVRVYGGEANRRGFAPIPGVPGSETGEVPVATRMQGIELVRKLKEGGKRAELYERTSGHREMDEAVHNPAALAAWIGRKKYGKAQFQKMAAAGRGKDASQTNWKAGPYTVVKYIDGGGTIKEKARTPAEATSIRAKLMNERSPGQVQILNSDGSWAA